jgi:hypothetical protein
MTEEEKKVDEKQEEEIHHHDEEIDRHDILSTVTWAMILIWAGLVFLASNMGWFTRLGWMIDSNWAFHSFHAFRQFGVWNLIALGAGAIVLFEAIFRLIVPEYRHSVGGNFIMAAIFVAIGLGGWLNWSAQAIWERSQQ